MKYIGAIILIFGLSAFCYAADGEKKLLSATPQLIALKSEEVLLQTDVTHPIYCWLKSTLPQKTDVNRLVFFEKMLISNWTLKENLYCAATGRKEVELYVQK